MTTREKRYADWQQIIDQYKQSGLSQKKFFAANGLSFRQFKYYRYRLQPPGSQKPSPSPASSAMPLPSTTAFTSIKLNTIQQASGNRLRLIHPSGIECLIPAEIN